MKVLVLSPGEKAVSRVRPAVVAGRFYPEDSRQLRDDVEELLAGVSPSSPSGPKALIAPHAGYAYSGPIAATAYAQLAPVRDVVRTVIVIGPAHRVAVAGVALAACDAFATPLGDVPTKPTAGGELAHLHFVQISEHVHELEHALEVHLPFLQTALAGPFEIVPLVVGDASAQQVHTLLETLWGGPETLIVTSSDLSHFLSYEEAQRVDAQTSVDIVAMEPSRLSERCACGRVVIQGLLLSAATQGLSAQLLDLRNSGDTGGGRECVVGYGAFALS
ncbi:MAG: AmmeMemoRadiSam system protein B [Candidatus Latescibacterota bacterium]|nr:AmmeMemoRadiSam system protein B [Candidatus Latescibacterota bacterium]